MKFFQKRSVAAAVLVLAVVAGVFIGQAKKPDTSEAPSTKIVGSYTYTYDYAVRLFSLFVQHTVTPCTAMTVYDNLQEKSVPQVRLPE